MVWKVLHSFWNGISTTQKKNEETVLDVNLEFSASDLQKRFFK
jgi:hypothetical protein